MPTLAIFNPEKWFEGSENFCKINDLLINTLYKRFMSSN